MKQLEHLSNGYMHFVKVQVTAFTTCEPSAIFKLVGAIAYTILGYVAPSVGSREALVALGLLIALDTATGIFSAHLRGEPIESRKMARAFIKTVAHFGGIAAVSIMGKAAGLGPDARAAIVTGAVGLVSAAEAWSIIENCEKMGVPLPPKVKALLRGIVKDSQRAEKQEA